jgi:hypothetical protein
MNMDIYGERYEIEEVLNRLDGILEQVKLSTTVHSKKLEISKNSLPMKYFILDLEGYFPKLAGFLISDFIYQFYIEEKEYQLDLYKVIYSIIKLLKDFFIITFSPWERRFMIILKNELMSQFSSQKELEFIDSLKIVDIQKRYFESLSAGVFSLDDKLTPDPVLRISDNVDLLFENRYLDVICEHNRSCLLSTLKLLKKRYFKLNLF